MHRLPNPLILIKILKNIFCSFKIKTLTPSYKRNPTWKISNMNENATSIKYKVIKHLEFTVYIYTVRCFNMRNCVMCVIILIIICCNTEIK